MTLPLGDPAEAYRALRRQHPDLFASVGEDGIKLLLDEQVIQQAEALAADRLAKRHLPREWARVGVVYRDQFLQILRDAVRFPGGGVGTYIRLVQPENGPGVVILPVSDQRALIIRHFRHATRSWHWEVPRGFGEAGQTPEENARRELAEEVGAHAARVVPLGPVFPDTGLLAGHVELFLAEIPSHGDLESAEGIAEAIWVEIADLEQRIADGRISDGFTIAAFTRARLRGLI